MTNMNFTITTNFKTLNEAVENLPFARVYQSPMQRENFFNISVSSDKGGDYQALKKLVEMAKAEGFKQDNYFENSGLFGDYSYTAVMYVDGGKTVDCSYDQNRVYIKD